MMFGATSPRRLVCGPMNINISFILSLSSFYCICSISGDPMVPWRPKSACMKHLTSIRERYDKSVSPETIYNLLPKLVDRPRIWYEDYRHAFYFRQIIISSLPTLHLSFFTALLTCYWITSNLLVGPLSISSVELIAIGLKD